MACPTGITHNFAWTGVFMYADAEADWPFRGCRNSATRFLRLRRLRRPIGLDKLTSLVEMPDGVPDDPGSLEEIIVGLCGSFLPLQKRTVYFIYQSATDLLLGRASDKASNNSSQEPSTSPSKLLEQKAESISSCRDRSMQCPHHYGAAYSA
jgi:hypothetical protein